jgi:hypothetical protein
MAVLDARSIRLPLLVALAVAAVASSAVAAPRCEKPCKVDTAACIQSRCAGVDGEARRQCIETCRGIGGCAAIRTLAYIWNECRSDARGITFRRELRIRRGNCAPVPVRTIGPAEPVPDPMHLCALYGSDGVGGSPVILGGFQRLAVTPDGSGVVFEVTNSVALFPGISPEPLDEGFFFVRADGTHLRWLAPPSRTPLFQLLKFPDPPLGFLIGLNSLNIAFSPDGETVVYLDRGPGPGGEEADQVVTLDVATRRRIQLTSPPPLEAGALCCPRFVDDDTILFFSNTDLGESLNSYTVRTNGSGFARLPPVVATPGGAVIPDFSIVGGGNDLLTIAVPGRASNDPRVRPEELFVFDGKDLLQLTNFGRNDTIPLFLGSRRRALFATGADPLGTNPTKIPQIFSIDTLGRRLRQLTVLKGAPLPCAGVPAPGARCKLFWGFQDPATDIIVFEASCGALESGVFGDQLFAMRPHGSGLRQLTNARECVVDADGSVTVERPGPFGYSAPSR